MRRLLVLRPEPGASETASRARERGLEVLAIPLFRIEAVEWKAPDAAQLDGLLLTSANAVRCSGKQLDKLRGLKAYAVGGATADAARVAGFELAAVGAEGVDQLLGSIDKGLHLLHLCGENRMVLGDPSQSVTQITVYRSRAIDAPDLQDIGGTIAMIHSPRAARRFAELVSERKSIAIAAISPAAVEAVGTGWERTAAASRPSDHALLALAARLCNNSPPE
jgi:uroporphyrinogen-III synthase